MKEFIDKLIGRLEEYKTKAYVTGITNNAYEFGACNAMDSAIRIVNQLAEEYKVSEMPTGWISVSERLPSGSGKYLVTAKNITGWWILDNNVFVCDYAYDTFIFQGWEDNEVIAWMPLPSPFKEGE
jgi:hypothetical protein